MPTINVLLPQFGMGMQEGEIARWAKAVGDQVVEGELLAEVEAAKATVDLPSPVTGTLVEILVEVGLAVEVRTPIARIRTG